MSWWRVENKPVLLPPRRFGSDPPGGRVNLSRSDSRVDLFGIVIVIVIRDMGIDMGVGPSTLAS